MKIKTSSAKAKGRRLQQLICKEIEDITGYPYGPDEAISSRPMGQAGTDVRLEKCVLKMFPFSVECKAQETWNVPAWIRQACKNKIDDTNWLLVMKRNREAPVVVLNCAVFFDIYYELLEYKRAMKKV